MSRVTTIPCIEFKKLSSGLTPFAELVSALSSRKSFRCN